MTAEKQITLPLPDALPMCASTTGLPSHTGTALPYSKRYYLQNKERLSSQRKEYKANNKAKVKAQQHASRMKHLEREAEYGKRYYQEHKEVSKARRKIRYQNTKEYVAQQGKIYREKNREEVKRRCAEWKKTHKASCRQSWHKRNALKKNSSVGDMSQIVVWETTWKSKKSVRCYWCNEAFSPSQCHTDHVVPISKCGNHSIDNLCISCSTCNTSKGAKEISSWNKQLTQPVLL